VQDAHNKAAMMYGAGENLRIASSHFVSVANFSLNSATPCGLAMNASRAA
jgi:hypothetical protein